MYELLLAVITDALGAAVALLVVSAVRKMLATLTAAPVS